MTPETKTEGAEGARHAELEEAFPVEERARAKALRQDEMSVPDGREASVAGLRG